MWEPVGAIWGGRAGGGPMEASEGAGGGGTPMLALIPITSEMQVKYPNVLCDTQNVTV